MAALRLVLFGGQGSQSIFLPNAANTAEKDAQSSSAGSIILSKCHAAFLEEISSLEPGAKESLGIDVHSFTSPRHLLRPSEQYHTHPALQATTIYLCQTLRYLAVTIQEYESIEHSFDALQSTAGFSSGILPAATVACSSCLDEFVASSVQGFRLAFWVALRSYFWTLENSIKIQVGGCSCETTLSLATRGISREQIEQKLKADETYSQLGVSCITKSGDVSISGPKESLCVLQKELNDISGVATTFAFVHGWYHGGDRLEPVVSQVLEDIDRRSISLPHISEYMKPIYSALDGSLFDASSATSDQIPEWLARQLLEHCVDWHRTSNAIMTDVQKLVDEGGSTIQILSLGPGSSSLFPDFDPPHPQVVFQDVSSFKGLENESLLSPDRINDIAIVGMSVQLPKGQGADQLWETLSQGLNAVREIPGDRFKLEDFYTDELDKPRSVSTRYGAFLDDPFCFDNTFFNISPREAKSMDPQQRILLHAAQEALEDAGYVPDATLSSQRATTGCYIGLATGDYTDNLRDDIDTFYPPGTLRAFHSGRISYFYQFSGPSIITDTACSSSTVSIYQACRAIQNGDCTSAIAGGVNVITSPDMYLGLSRGHFLSPTGNCKPFDATADGYCRAEGCVLFVLKRLSDAITEGDRIYGVIRSAQINQSGNSSSITHPHSPTQTDLLQRLLKSANVNPGSVSVVEAHGTGTQAGDTREIETLKLVFGQHHCPSNPLIVSSIKGNIGHCEAASGAAGLAKLLLMFRQNQVPRQVGLNNLNPALGDIQSAGLVIPRSNMAWKRSAGKLRRAVLNNFGAAGSNASLLVEEWTGVSRASTHRHKRQDTPERSSYIFTLSAKSEKALESAVDRYTRFLSQCTPASLEDICYTATARRQHYNQRISMTCNSKADLLTKLQQSNISKSQPAKDISSIAFVFTGQGALYSGMGEELMSTYPPFKDTILSCDRVIQGLGLSCPSILHYATSKGKAHFEAFTHVEHLMASQCAITAVEYALANMFISWGIKPDYVMGHSLGEYAALAVSGVLTLEDTFRVIASRAKMMADLCVADVSGMLACQMTPEESQTMIQEDPPLRQLTLACLNGPRDCVVGGPLSQLDVLQTRCKTRNIRSKLINVPYAFHTKAMDPLMEPLRELGKSVKFGDATFPIISNVDGRLTSNDFTSDHFAKHTRQPVLFYDGLITLQKLIGRPALDDSLFLEVGPHPALLPMIRESITSSSCTYLSTLQRGRDSWSSISQILSAIALRKVTVDWREVFAGTSAQVTSLPGHLLEGPKFHIPFQEHHTTPVTLEPTMSRDSGRVRTQHALLPWLRTDTSSTGELVFETDMTTLGPLILGHDVGGTPICPASVFYELAIEAAQSLLEPPKSYILVVTGVNFSSPLIYLPSQPDDVTVRVCVTKKSDSSIASFKATSLSLSTTLHCSGNIASQQLNANSPQWMRDHALVTRQSRFFSGEAKDQTSIFRTKALYEAIFSRVVRYSKDYQSLQYINVADSNLEGIGSFKMPSRNQVGTRPGPIREYLAHPVFTDTLLHAAGFIANLAIGSREIGICSTVESIEVTYQKLDYQDTFKIYCNLLEIKGTILADTIALDSADRVVAVIRGMKFKKLQLSTFQQSLSRISSTDAAKSEGRELHQRGTRLPMLKMPAKLEVSQTSNSTQDQDDSRASPVSDDPFVADTRMSPLLKGIVMEVGGFSEADIDYTMSLGDLGIDSMMQIEIASKLSRLFPGQIGLDHGALSECETLEEMDSILSSTLQMSDDSSGGFSRQSTEATTPLYAGSSGQLDMMHQSETLPVTLHVSERNQTPLCLFHDGSGQISMYRRIRGHDRTAYAFFDPYFGAFEEKQSFFSSVSEMAEEYASMIMSNQRVSSTPLILGGLLGWSFGGIVAYEAAQHLSMRGLKVRGLVLIDSPSPVNHEPLPAAVIASLANSRGTNALQEEFLSNASLLGTYKPVSFHQVTGVALKTVVLRSQETLDTEALCGVRYDWLSRQDTRDAAVETWEALVGGPIEVLPIPGNHFQPFSDDKVRLTLQYSIIFLYAMLISTMQINETSAQLWKACQCIERR
uniref:Putative polyketide synthase n=1 Tax=Gibberella sacchari TaxID=42676 RepID=A0A0U2S511_GIBSA|nr:putative polyketide synthase [Fusarium sacchari]